jgi:hypothetical protein
VVEESDWLRRFHLGDRTVRGTGLLDILPAERRTGRVLGRLLRFPPAGTALPLRVEIVRGRSQPPGRERWTRSLGGRRLDTVQTHDGDLVRERFGLVELRMQLTDEGTALRLSPGGADVVLRGWRLRLPRWCAPQASAYVWAQPAERPGRPRFGLRVRIRVPVMGRLLSYSGHVEEDDDG